MYFIDYGWMWWLRSVVAKMKKVKFHDDDD